MGTKHEQEETVPALPRLPPATLEPAAPRLSLRQGAPSSSSTILLGPACLPSSFPPPHPSFWNSFPFLDIFNLSHIFLNLSVHLHTRPFFVIEKQSVTMGYTKTDELAINTIRVLAVSTDCRSCNGTALPLHRRCRCRPLNSSVSPPKSATITPRSDQSCSQIFTLG